MLQLYDSLQKKVVPFEPKDGKTVRMYACGPTVYDYMHIGNLRSFCTVDMLRRYLEYSGYDVQFVMNITDVGHAVNDDDIGEDKMEKSAAKQKKTPWEIAAFYTEAFFRDIAAVGIKPAMVNPKATDHIPEMIALVETLLEKGDAYVTAKQDIYFDVAKFKGYGKLSGNTVDALVAGARVEVKDDKRHRADFALWIHNPLHIMQWTGPRGIQGYPGWHLECSAMSMKYLGETLDIHTGGEDNKFPHHECEIAQSESATGKPFSRYWFHVKHLMVDGEKMSKSKGNFYTISDLTAKGYSPEAVRYLLLSAHYSTPLNFTLEGLDAAEKTVSSLRDLAARLEVAAAGHHEAGDSPFETHFKAAMDDNLNVSAALAVLHVFSKEVNKAFAGGDVGNIEASVWADFLRDFDYVFGLGLFKAKAQQEIPADVQSLIDARASARLEKRWVDSDKLRDEIAAKGFEVKDTAKGQEVRKK